MLSALDAIGERRGKASLVNGSMRRIIATLDFVGIIGWGVGRKENGYVIFRKRNGRRFKGGMAE